LSDHLPVLFSLPLTSNASVFSRTKTPVYVYRWDKGNLSLYNSLIGDLLSRIYHPTVLTVTLSVVSRRGIWISISIITKLYTA